MKTWVNQTQFKISVGTGVTIPAGHQIDLPDDYATPGFVVARDMGMLVEANG